MAIKKCDDIIDEAAAASGVDGETGASPSGDPASGQDTDAAQDTAQGATELDTESQNLADQIVEIETGGMASAEMQEQFYETYQSEYKPKENAYLGKTLTAVESSNCIRVDQESTPLLAVASFGNGQVKSSRPPDISDPLRAELRAFFSPQHDTAIDTGQGVFRGQIEYLNKMLDGSGWWLPFAHDIYGNPAVGISSLAAPIETMGTAGSLFKAYRQGFSINSISNKWTENSDTDGVINLDPAWEAFINGGKDSITGLERPSAIIDTTTTFTDHYIKITSPFTPKELERFANPINNPAYAKVVPTYNFYVPGYEDYISNADIKEYQLQNQLSEITKLNSYIQESLSAFGADYDYIKNVLILAEKQGYDITEKFQNIGLSDASVKDIKQVTQTDDLYTMHNFVELQTDKTGQFLTSADEADMIDDILKLVMDQHTIYSGDIATTAQNNNLPFTVSSEVVTYNNNDTILSVQSDEFKIPLINLTSWLLTYFSKAGPDPLPDEFGDIAILLGIDPNKAEQSDDCSAFVQTLKSLVLSGKISQIVHDRFRTFEEMMTGKEAYNETVIYEIVRSGGSRNQRIFVPNTEDLDIFQYVDTQVKYNTDYKYEIFAHQLIVGTSYSYDNFSGAQSGKTANFAVQYEPSLQIARLPIFEQTVKILDSAPIFPDVDLVPYKGVPNRLLINLRSNTGEYVLDPVIITEADQQFVDAYRAARELSSNDPITYKSDDHVSTFEIYRTTDAPRSYSDFANSLLTTIGSSGTAASFIDDIVPNTKYYYMFRSVDVHDNRSNPTDVYMAELVQFEGMIFFNMSVYNFEDIVYNNVKASKSFRRYLKLNPNFIQSLIDYDKSFPTSERNSAHDVSTLTLGRAQDSPWNKRYKVRVTSKHTGRKFDLNFTCKHELVRTEKLMTTANPDVTIPKVETVKYNNEPESYVEPMTHEAYASGQMDTSTSDAFQEQLKAQKDSDRWSSYSNGNGSSGDSSGGATQADPADTDPSNKGKGY